MRGLKFSKIFTFWSLELTVSLNGNQVFALHISKKACLDLKLPEQKKQLFFVCFFFTN